MQGGFVLHILTLHGCVDPGKPSIFCMTAVVAYTTKQWFFWIFKSAVLSEVKRKKKKKDVCVPCSGMDKVTQANF